MDARESFMRACRFDSRNERVVCRGGPAGMRPIPRSNEGEEGYEERTKPKFNSGVAARHC